MISLLEGCPTKTKLSLFPHGVRLTPLDTNQYFNVSRINHVFKTENNAQQFKGKNLQKKLFYMEYHKVQHFSPTIFIIIINGLNTGVKHSTKHQFFNNTNLLLTGTPLKTRNKHITRENFLGSRT